MEKFYVAPEVEVLEVYVAPEVEVLEVEIEKGFEGSVDFGGDVPA